MIILIFFSFTSTNMGIHKIFFIQAIKHKFEGMSPKECFTRIFHVDCQNSINNSVVVQVLFSFFPLFTCFLQRL